MTKLELKQKELIELKNEIIDFRESHSGDGWSIKDRMKERARKLESEIAELEAEEQEPTPDLDCGIYLNECIKKAEPNLSKIADVDQELAEIRGEEPSKGAEEILTVYFKHNNCSDEFIKAEIDRFINCPKCRQAMEQYRAEELREELIKFRDYCYNALIICDNKQIDEYLKQKP
jgi:hypothetical protein